MKSFLKQISIPLICIATVLSLYLIWFLFDFPPREEMITIAKGYFETYGIITIFIASLIEGMLLVGWYAPGGLIIFLGVILSAGNPAQAAASVSATILGFIIAYTLNYYIGKYGWYRLLLRFGLSGPLENAKARFQKQSFKAIYLTYWQPNLGGLVATSAGILHANPRKFFFTSALGAILWSAFWGLSAYFLGEKILEYLGIVFFGIMIGWIIVEIVKYRRQV